jgi:PE-PPE domain
VITLFTVAGTGHPGAAGARSTGRGCFPQKVGQRVDPAKYTWRPVAYAAGMPFTRSVAGGITKLTDAINNTDGDFAIAAYSQGAMVAAPVYRSLRSGALSHRRSNLRAVVAFANPAREAGHTFPGCADPGGHGIMSAEHRLTDTEDLWWDFAIPNDLAATVDDDLAGRWLTTIFMAFCGQSAGGVRVVADTLRGAPANMVPLASRLLPYFSGAASTNGAPHGRYDAYTPLPGNPKTCVDLAVDYLDSIAVRGA